MIVGRLPALLPPTGLWFLSRYRGCCCCSSVSPPPPLALVRAVSTLLKVLRLSEVVIEGIGDAEDVEEKDEEDEEDEGDEGDGGDEGGRLTDRFRRW